MLQWLVASSLRARFIIVGIALVALLIGVERFYDKPLDLYPELAPPYVTIQTEALGLSAEEVEAMITVPLEADMLNGVSWVKDLWSESIPGLSSITLVFEPGTDILAARQLVQERLTAVYALPNVSKPPTMLNPVSSTGRILQIGLSSTTLSPIELSVLARWTIQPRLLGVKGVANVAIWGERRRQLQVQVDPKRLHADNLSVSQIVETTGNSMFVSPLSFLNASTPGTGGFIDTPNQRLGVRHVLPITSPDDLAGIKISGTPYRLGDVSEVVEDHQVMIGDAVMGSESNVLLVLEKFPYASTIEVTKTVEAALQEMRPGLPGVAINTELFRPARFADEVTGTFWLWLVSAIILASLVSAVLLKDWKSGVVCLVSVGVSLSAAWGLLEFLGVPINAMVFLGIAVALSILIDDAVIVGDAILSTKRAARANGEERSAFRVISEATVASRSWLTYAMVVLVVAVAPAFFLPSVTGAFLGPVAAAYLAAVVVSMLIGMTVGPALYFILSSRAGNDSATGGYLLAQPLERVIAAGIPRVAQRPKGALAVLAGGAIFTLIAFSLLERQVSPQFNERDILVSWQAAPGASHPAMLRLAHRAAQALRDIPGVASVGAHVGRAVLSDRVANVNRTELWLSIDPSADYDATLAAIQGTVSSYPGVDDALIVYPQQRIEEVGRDGDDHKLVTRVYGSDFDVLEAKAVQISQAIGNIEGVVDTEVEGQAVEPVIQIRPDLARSLSHGIRPGDVRRQSATLLSGIEVGSLFEEQKVFDVVVWGVPQTRKSITDVRELVLEAPDGTLVPLHEVADVEIVPQPTVVKRDAVSRHVDVVAEVAGDIDDIAAGIEERIQQVDFPLEYHAEIIRAPFEYHSARDRARSVIIASVVVVFLVFQACLGSWRLAAVAFLGLPAALAGCLVVAILIGDGLLSFGAILGCLGTFGLATRQNILLLRRCQQLQREDSERSRVEVAARAARERVGPITSTAVATVFALLSLVLFGDRGGMEILHPLAGVLLGGLVTSTLLSLFITPAAYVAVNASSGSTSELDLGGSEAYAN